MERTEGDRRRFELRSEGTIEEWKGSPRVHTVRVMKIAHDKVPSHMRERYGNQIRQLSEELQELEAEFHKLNVEQIREELKASQTNP